MKRKLMFVIFPCLMFAISSSAQKPDGTLSGVVKDREYREPLMGATVYLNELNRTLSTDSAGCFAFTGIPSGVYSVRVSYISFKEQLFKEIRVDSGRVTNVAVEMTDDEQMMNEVVVLAVRRQTTERAVMGAIQNSLVVQAGVSAQQISLTQDRDASEVVKRIPGISLIDNKFINVRGLAQRYNNVWINRAGVPSSEADTRAFSFDIIPSSQIDNMVVIKSPAPEYPADFTGGFVQINTKDVPDKNLFSVTLGTSLNDRTHFNPYYSGYSSSTDWLGFDSNRGVRVGYPSRIDNNDAALVTDFTRNGLNNDWTVKRRNPLPDLRLNVQLNRRFDLENGKYWALLSAFNYTNSYNSLLHMENSRFSIYDAIHDKSVYLYKYTDNQYTNDVRLGGMLNLTFAPNNRDKFEFKNMVNQLGRNRYTDRSGYQYISGYYVQEKQEYSYSSRNTYSGQFSGTHLLPESKWDWSLGYAYANRNQPDRRIINREENGFAEDDHYGEMQVDQNQIQREFGKLNEHIVSFNLNYNRAVSIGSFKPEIRTGLYGEYRHRIYDTRSFYYRWNGANLPDGFSYLPVVGQILQPENFGADKLYVYEETDNQNSYKGNNLLCAGYLGVNVPINRFNLYAGVRYEDNRMKLINYVSIKEFQTESRQYVDGRFYPSVNTTYRFNDRHQLRLAYGASVNRPEFREVSPSVYYDFELFSDVKGNPNLKTAHIQNVDLRYEFYPNPGETVSLALFYKQFRDPIEWTYLDAGGSYTYTFENARSARNFGLELDIKKSLGFIGLPHFSFNFNGALVSSRVYFDDHSLEVDRPMQGQSPYIINTGLFYSHPRYDFNMALLYNRIGKRIVGVGRVDMTDGATVNNDIPDSYEMPRNTIDLTFSKKLGRRFEIKAAVRDLLGEKVTFKQFPKFKNGDGGTQQRSQVTKQFRPGRNFFVSVSYTL